MLKPASATPLSALLLAELMDEAGLPPGWLNVVAGSSSEIGDVLIDDERVAALTFTGSGDVGWKLKERAPRKHVDARARQRDAGDRVRGRARRHRGEARRARVLVRRAELHLRAAHLRAGRGWDAFVADFVPKVEALKVGDPADEETDVGPVIDDDARERILAWVGESDGELLTGGDTTDEGLIRPTVIANPSPRREGVVRGGLRARRDPDAHELARRGDRARELDPVRASGRHLHRQPPGGARGRAESSSSAA